MKTQILFVDDDPMLLASTRRQLMRSLSGCQLYFFESAREALEHISSSPVDIVLTDVRMPEMDGAEFLTHICAKMPDVIRLAWTGQSDGAQLDRVQAVAHEVFGKPIPTEQFTSMVTAVVGFSTERKKRLAAAEDLPEISIELGELFEKFSDIIVREKK